jgi:uncharacterized protein involved in outer membrane biogenesis
MLHLIDPGGPGMTSKSWIPSKSKKTLIWCVAALALVTVLCVALLLAAPALVQTRIFKERVVALVAHRIDGQLGYTDLRLRVFPFPVVDIHGLTITLPDGVAARSDTLSVAIRILPLIKGQLQLREFRLETPQLRISLVGSAQTPSSDTSAPAGGTPAEQIAQIVGILKQLAGDASVKFRNGSIRLMDGDTVFDTWQGVDLTYSASPAVMRVDLSTTSTSLGRLKADLLIEPASLDMDGRIDLDGAPLPHLTAQLLPPGPVSVTEGRLRLGIRFNAQQLFNFDADLVADIPELQLQRNDQTLVIEGLTLAAGVQRRSETMKIELTALNLTQPALAISGAATRQVDTGWRVEVATQPMEIAPVRTLARKWAGDLSVVNTIFDILQSGRIQTLTARASGGNLQELAALGHLTASAQVDKVSVRIPETDLEVAEIAGRIDLDQRVLSARVDDAGLIGTRLAHGHYRMDLGTTPLALQAEIGVQTDLAKLPVILSKVLDAETQDAVSAQMKAISGSADGRFEIEGPVNNLRWMVLVNALTGRFENPRLPFPMVVEKASGRFAGADTRLTIDHLDGRVGRSSVRDLSGRLDLGETAWVRDASARLDLALGELFAWAQGTDAARETLAPLNRLDGRAVISDLRFTGPVADPLAGDFRLRGRLQEVGISAATDQLPDDLALSADSFQVSPAGIQFTDLTAALSDISLTASGMVSDPFSKDRSLRLSAGGKLGPLAARWALEKFGATDWVRLVEPLDVSRLSVVSDLKRVHKISGALQTAAGQAFTAELHLAPEQISIPSITVRDTYSDARIGFERQAGRSTARFDGHLDLRSIGPFLADNLPHAGWVAGGWRATLAGADWRDTRITGTLEGGGLRLQLPEMVAEHENENDALRINSFTMAATGNQLVLRSAVLNWEETDLQLEGWLNRSEKGVHFDLQAKAPFVDADALLAKIQREETAAPQTETPSPASTNDRRPAMEGDLRLRIEHLNYEGYDIRPLAAKIRISGDRTLVEIPQADLCEVSLAGSLDRDPKGMKLVFQPTSATRKVGEALSCLFQKPIEADGHLYLVGDVRAEGSPETLLETLNGQVVMTATEGRIYKANLLAKILALVNVTEIFAGQYPGFTEEGMSYKRLELGGQFDKGIFAVDTCNLDSPSLQMSCRGSVDLPKREMDITILAAPLKTVDRIVKKLPVIGYVLGGSLISIPIKVQGPLGDPKVVPLSPEAVGKGTLDILKRTLQVPVKVLQPLTGSQ